MIERPNCSPTRALMQMRETACPCQTVLCISPGERDPVRLCTGSYVLSNCSIFEEGEEPCVSLGCDSGGRAITSADFDVVPVVWVSAPMEKTRFRSRLFDDVGSVCCEFEDWPLPTMLWDFTDEVREECLSRISRLSCVSLRFDSPHISGDRRCSPDSTRP